MQATAEVRNGLQRYTPRENWISSEPAGAAMKTGQRRPLDESQFTCLSGDVLDTGREPDPAFSIGAVGLPVALFLCTLFGREAVSLQLTGLPVTPGTDNPPQGVEV